VPWGAPVYAHGKALAIARYFPDPVETERLTEFVRGNGGAAFFARPDWRAVLLDELDRVRKGSSRTGRRESSEEKRERWRAEFAESKRLIEDKTGRPAEHFVFPGGGYTAESFELAQSTFKTVAIKSPDNERVRNHPGDDPRSTSRRGTQLVVSGERARYTGGAYLLEYLKEYQGSSLARRRRQVMKLAYLAGLRMGVWG